MTTMSPVVFSKYIAEKGKSIRPLLAAAPVLVDGRVAGADALEMAGKYGYNAVQKTLAYLAECAFGPDCQVKAVRDAEAAIVNLKDHQILVWFNADGEAVYHRFYGWTIADLAAQCRMSLA